MRTALIPLLLLLVTGSGCASLAKGFNQEIKVSSVPPGAKVYLDGVESGVTPNSLYAKRSRGHTVIIESASGKQSGTTLTPKVNALFWLDLILFWPAVFIDLATGGMYNLDPPAVMMVEQSGPAITAPPVVARKLSTVAVADLDAQGTSGTDAAVISDVLRNRLINTAGFKVVEKNNMNKVLAEQAFQQTGCTSQECAVKLGKVLNVQGMVVGSFGKLLGRYIVSVRVVEVETGSVVLAEEAKGDTVDALTQEIQAMAGRIGAAAR